MTLLDLAVGQIATILNISHGHHGHGLVTRLEALGIIPDKPIQVLRKSSFGGPLHLRVGSTTEVAMRRSEAQCISVTVEE
jgi:ferrous iron transport protein A